VLTLLILAAIAVAAFFIFRPVYRQLVLGNHLTRLTNVYEQLAANRALGLETDAMPKAQMDELERQFERSADVFRQYPPSLITRELLKNSIVAKDLGLEARSLSILHVIEMLAGFGLAMRIEDFERDMFLAQHGYGPHP
jgi:hypothetical protein